MEVLENKMLKKLVREDLYFGDWDLIKRNLKIDKRVIGITDNDKLIAFHVLDFPIREENLGVDLDFSEEDSERVGQIGPICIDPDYHGHGLMAKILAPHLEISKECGRPHILATVSPYNYGSMKWCLTHGFLIKKITKKYGGMLRAVVHLDMSKDIHTYENITSYIVKNDDIKKQTELLSRGYYGHSLSKTENGFNIYYALISMLDLIKGNKL
jgi:hypothetical protein